MKTKFEIDFIKILIIGFLLTIVFNKCANDNIDGIYFPALTP